MAGIDEIAELVGAAAPSIASEILRVSGIETATPVALVFASDAATLRAALNSPAGAILTTDALLAKAETPGVGSRAGVAARTAQSIDPTDPRLLPVADPRYAFALAARFLRSREEAAGESGLLVHPTAVLGAGVRLGKGTTIGPHAVLGEGVTLGEDCIVLANVTIYSGTIIGNRVVVQAGAVLGATGFGYARNSATGEYLAFPQQGTLVIEDDVEIGANTTIDRGALDETRIGRGTKIDNLVHIGHNCRLGQNVVIAAQTGLSGSIVIENDVVLGGQVGIGEHARIEEGVMLGGQGGVLPNKVLRGKGVAFWGTPAQPVREYLKQLAALARLGKKR